MRKFALIICANVLVEEGGGSLWNIWIAIVRVLDQLYDQNMGSEKSGDWNIFGGDWGLGNFP